MYGLPNRPANRALPAPVPGLRPGRRHADL